MLTKSDFIKHEECPIWLWMYKMRKDLLPEESDALSRIFAQGNEIDQLARKLYPEGVEIEERFEKGYNETKERIKQGATVMFQPSAVTLDGLAATADILTLDPKTGLWDLREVKSSTHVKEEYLIDVAFQKNCLDKAGIKIGRTFLILVNNEYVRQGDLEVEKLFIQEDITEQVLDHMDDVRKQIQEAKKVIEMKKSPDSLLIQKCHDPKKCEYLPYYIHGFPEVYSLLDTIPDDHLKALLDRGVLDYTQVSEEILNRIGFKPPEFFEKINPKGIKEELDQLVYPLYFFDYETYGPAVPPFDGYHPYQAIPFQYSLHIQEKPEGELEHKEYLPNNFSDPVPNLLEQLKGDIGPTGTVIAWNDSFEKGRNKEMAEMYPEYTEFLYDVNSRMFDLMKLFKFNRKLYLHSDFQKSASLKKVLPVICPHLSYSDLEIHEGGTASACWPIMTGKEKSDLDLEKLRSDMLAYCERDTLAMVEILRHLRSKTI